MSLRKYGLRQPLYSRARQLRLAAVTAMLAVSLTACSDLLAEMNREQLSEAPKLAQAEAAKPLPDIPPHLAKCVDKIAPPGKTANEKVLNLRKTDEERRVCARAILTWYRGLQNANKQAMAAPKK